jgi:hypothetical protein
MELEDESLGKGGHETGNWRMKVWVKVDMKQRSGK